MCVFSLLVIILTFNLSALGLDGGRCRMICGNALEQDISSATCFFLYLVPRGLRIIWQKILADIPKEQR